MAYTSIAGVALAAVLLVTEGFAQSPPQSPQQPVPVPALQSRGDQQLAEWQRLRAEEYQRRWLEYLASIARMA